MDGVLTLFEENETRGKKNLRTEEAFKLTTKLLAGRARRGEARVCKETPRPNVKQWHKEEKEEELRDRRMCGTRWKTKRSTNEGCIMSQKIKNWENMQRSRSFAQPGLWASLHAGTNTKSLRCNRLSFIHKIYRRLSGFLLSGFSCAQKQRDEQDRFPGSIPHTFMTKPDLGFMNKTRNHFKAA